MKFFGRSRESSKKIRSPRVSYVTTCFCLIEIEGSVYLDDSVPVAGEVEEVGADGREATGEERLAVVA